MKSFKTILSQSIYIWKIGVYLIVFIVTLKTTHLFSPFPSLRKGHITFSFQALNWFQFHKILAVKVGYFFLFTEKEVPLH